MWSKFTDFLKANNLANFEKTDCLVCLNAPTKPCFFPFKGVCRHLQSSYTKKSYFTISISQYIITWIVIVIFLFITALNLYPLFEICPVDKNSCLSMVNYQIIIICGLMLTIIRTLKINILISYLNSWNEIINNQKNGEYNVSLTRKVVFQNSINTYILRLFYNIAIILFAAYMTYQCPFDLILVQRLAVFFSVYIQTNFAFHFIEHVKYFKENLHNLTYNIKQTFNERLTNKTKSRNLILVESSFEIDARKYRKYWIHAERSLRYVNEFLNPGVLFWIVFCLALLILNIYMLISNWNRERTKNLIFLELQTYGIVVLVTYMSSKLEFKHSVSVTFFINVALRII